VEVTVHLHGVLSRYADGHRHLEITVADEATVDEVLDELAERYPAVERRIRDETRTVRQHLNLFVDGEQLRELGGVEHRLHPGAELLILPAVSGGG
jgi:sulfur-carrier protein